MGEWHQNSRDLRVRRMADAHRANEMTKKALDLFKGLKLTTDEMVEVIDFQHRISAWSLLKAMRDLGWKEAKPEDLTREEFETLDASDLVDIVKKLAEDEPFNTHGALIEVQRKRQAS